MKLTKSTSKKFVVLPARWQADRARELILSHPNISHAIVATEPDASFYSPGDAVELIGGKDWFDLPKINIEITRRPWEKLGLSPSGRLYVVRRDEFVGLDDEEREKILKMLIRIRDWNPARLIFANTPPENAQELGVMIDESRMVGIVDPHRPEGGVYVPGAKFTKGVIEFTPPELGSDQPPSNIPPSGGDGDEPPSGDFNAFPRLDAPNELEPQQEFAAVVGYRPDQDPTLPSSKPIHIENPPPNATMRISVSAFGARILTGSAHKLPLKMEAEANIRCVVEPGVEKVTLFADYFYDSQLIGNATREISVNIPGNAPVYTAESESEPARFGTPTKASAVDMTVVITKVGDHTLKWEIEGPALSKPIEIEHPISGAREFAWKILSDLNAKKDGIGANNIIDYYSDLVSDVMPEEFFEALRKVHEAVKNRPVILIHTDEMYVPWELAAVKPALDDAYGPRALRVPRLWWGAG